MRKTETYFRYLGHETGQAYKRCPLPMRINVEMCLKHNGITVIFAFCSRFKHIFCHLSIKNLQNHRHIKQFYNLTFGDYGDYCL